MRIMGFEPEKLRRNAFTIFDAISAPALKRIYLDPDFADELVIQVLGGDASGTNVLTLTANLADGDIIRIGTLSRGLISYTAQTVLTNVAFNFFIGATASITIDNLIAAILLTAGAGTLYAAATTKHPDVSAAAGAGDTLDATALRKGTLSNGIETTETSAVAAWTSATLLGGTAFVGTIFLRTSMDDVEFRPVQAELLLDGTFSNAIAAVGMFRIAVGGLLVLLFDVDALSVGEITILGWHRGLARG